ncbi:MAG TPA: serine hydrolase domain-containing protein [Myxococcota bacterium]|nr:serine hydrolase domain-containing protein [Myxococcota bacterium]
MLTIKQDVPNGRIEGTCDERFAGVAREFARNFEERGEVGASASLTLHGETLVDLWGGVADPATGRAWERDTVGIVFSCTKGATALCAHLLASRGLLDIDAPVAEYWPEFAVRGKEHATVRMMLDHSAGVPVISAPVRAGGSCDWDYMISLLEAQEPFWKPGTRNGYHMINFGWTVGELVRRVSSKSLGAFFRDELARPLGIDFWIGTPEEIEPRVAPVIYYVPPPGEAPGEFLSKVLTERESIQALSLLNTGGFDANARACHAAEIGGGAGISNARGLARLYAPFACGGKLDGKSYVDAATLARMGETSMATHQDATLLIPTRFALGFMKSMDNRRRARGDRDSAILSSAAFGHVGAGGSIGFADPREELSFGYSMNRMGKGILLNERGQALIDAAYQALGYASNASGVWARA